MAFSSLLALIDDIATILDDVAILTKVAAKKTAGVLGDDLALNAEQVSGVRADRELPVVWAVAKGSLLNKAILVPAALAISAVVPWAIVPLLMLGGAFLCFEGFEKLAHGFLHEIQEDVQHHAEIAAVNSDPVVDLVATEQDKIKGAIRTDFVLSAEIIVITLGTVAAASFAMKAVVLTTVAIAMTLGVYGLVGLIVRLDDMGLTLIKASGVSVLARIRRGLGRAILMAAPRLMRFLSVAGAAAMFIVGGGILAHGIGPIHHGIEGIAVQLAISSAAYGGLLGDLATALLNATFGVMAGGALVVTMLGMQWLRRRFLPQAARGAA